MKYAHLLSAVYGTPWHLRSENWFTFHTVLQKALAGEDVSPVAPIAAHAAARHLQLSQYGASAPRPIVGPVCDGTPLVPQMLVIEQLAIIPAHGVLGKKLAALDLVCGGCDYLYLTEFVEQARADASISQVLFDFDSPGGMSSGCGECGDSIARLTAEKPTVAFTEGQCCSAAYWLASQCSEIWAAPTAMVGNIGTVMCAVDNSAEWTMAGRKLELFASSPLKATGANGKPWSDADRAYMQERLEQCDARIKSAVKRGRPQIADAALDGRWFFGENCADLGVIDAVAADLDEVIQALLS